MCTLCLYEAQAALIFELSMNRQHFKYASTTVLPKQQVFDTETSDSVEPIFYVPIKTGARNVLISHSFVRFEYYPFAVGEGFQLIT